ncbi:glucose-1-phosphate thymidylyltransferase RfbA [Oscillatoria amoena NRMC-F 0135]|nr:glucose-1-phosphate thymidylyltransferase RfbA [Oscillatoria laete-virens]MDL5047203.1 glucose-1-phosphate thymidylyltransferase RfbA [Oscillatoria amoena NRMC-F 0135]MDL5055465.1 glucose-1-phosphate thymidylyltransferase RfbA [Oscillatoria laete-virens NRMC-F 0139]
MKNRKGIILAGGTGTRLFPNTIAVSKQLMPVYDKPMIYYPLSVLMLAGIREILLITTPHDQDAFRKLLGNGSQYGLRIEYAIQERPDGLAQALIIAEDFLQGSPSCLVLGDNLFFGHDLAGILSEATQQARGSTIFGYQVSDPERYGVVEFDGAGKAISLEEKPDKPRSHYAIPGIYFYDETASAKARSLKPSPRGELEITDLNRVYMEEGLLSVAILGRGIAWLDTGTADSLMDAANFVQVIQNRQGTLIACLEEIAYNQHWLDKADLEQAITRLGKSAYAGYLRKVLS